MADPNAPKIHPTRPPLPIGDALHKRVFNGKQDVAANDTAAEASSTGAAFGVSPVQLDHTKPMRHIGDSDPGDFQPDNGPRR